MKKTKIGRCDDCHRRRKLRRGHVYQLNYYPEFINNILKLLPDSFVSKLLYFLPDSWVWWFSRKKIPRFWCEECYIASNNGIYSLCCNDCHSIIYIRYRDFWKFNDQKSGNKLLEDGDSMSLTERGMVCPYCKSENIHNLSFVKGDEDE